MRDIKEYMGKPLDAIVVGGGLFGQIIAKALRKNGRHVVVLDSKKKGAGSKPAACLMKPSWFSSMGKDKYEPSLELLDKLYCVQDILFTAGKIFNATVHWIPPKKILDGSALYPDLEVEVLSVGPGYVIYQENFNLSMDSTSAQSTRVVAPLIVVAAGIWTEKLLPQYKQTAQKGIAFLEQNARIQTPTITPWAPYRQTVVFNRGDGVWVSDGTAILEKNWTEKREQTAFERCRTYLPGNGAGAVSLTGIRPYAKGHKPCLLEQIEPGLWVASGGAKNGTIAAGWCAHEIVRRTS